MPVRKIRLISAIRQNIGGRWYLAGDEFDISEEEAADLIATRFATLAPPPKVEVTYRRRDMRAEK